MPSSRSTVPPSGYGVDRSSENRNALRVDVDASWMSRCLETAPNRPPGFETSIRLVNTSTCTGVPSASGEYSRWVNALAMASRNTSCGYIGGCDGCAPESAPPGPDVHAISEATASSIMIGIGPVMVSEATSRASPVNTSSREVPG